jgi:hypothetical protein
MFNLRVWFKAEDGTNHTFDCSGEDLNHALFQMDSILSDSKITDLKFKQLNEDGSYTDVARPVNS